LEVSTGRITVTSLAQVVPAGPMSQLEPTTMPSGGAGCWGSGAMVMTTVLPVSMAPAGTKTITPLELEATPPV
jgi:hypothetical protein